MKRDIVIWKAAITAVGAAMGYSVDELLAGAAHVLQATNSEGHAAISGGRRSTAPSTPNPRAGARPGVTDSPGSKGDPDVSVAHGGAGIARVELGVVHPSPCALPVPATRIWSLKETPGSVPITHHAQQSVVHAGGTKPVVLAIPAKRKRDDTAPSAGDAEGDVHACKGKGKGQGRSSKYKGVRKEKRGKWSAKILFREKNKAKRTQMRLGAYNKELEAATAYAAAVHVVKEGKRVSGTVDLSEEEKGLLKGCTLAESQDDEEEDVAGCASQEGEEEIELEGDRMGGACAKEGQGTPHELNEDAAEAMDGVAEQGIHTGVALGDAIDGAMFDVDPEAGASQVTPNAAVESSVGAGDEEVGSDGGGEAAPVRSKAVASVLVDAPGTVNDKAAKAPPPPVPDNPFVAMPCASAQQPSGSRREEAFPNDNVVISRAELEALKTARDDGDRWIARLEALLLAVQDPRQRDQREERTGDDARSRKRRRVESGSEDATSADDDEAEAEAQPVRARRLRRRRHMTVSSSPILQEAFDFMPEGKAWKVTDTILNWDMRKGRLSNSAGGNAQVVNGLHEVAGAAVAQAIQDFKPKYDDDAAAWVWGEHGLMLSSCGLEYMIPDQYAQRTPVVEEGASVSRGSG
ncbi:unnamed protein product [Closterium sp. Naga37s-1]|nr:unnamed protein product [Closterium sp. Naga37s-1]